VDGGIVSYAVATAYPRQEKIRYSLIPVTAHSPINHRMVLTKKSSDIARDFYQFMQTDTATKILTDHGFNRVSSTQ